MNAMLTGSGTCLHAALTPLFPPERRLLEPAAISAWAHTTHPLPALPEAVVTPLVTTEVQAAVRAARAAGVAVHAIGRGRNIGLGGRVPPLARGRYCVIDLQAMRAIRAMDEAGGAMTLEPGVTFADVHAALAHHGSHWFLPATGGPADGSVLGNLLERGDGAGPGGDRVSRFLDLEAVLPDGRILSTQRDAAGPDASGLFFQSAAGIVTAASLALVRLPRVMTKFVFRMRQEGRLDALVDAVATACREGVLAPGAASLWNGDKRAILYGTTDDAQGWALSGALHAVSRRRQEADWQDLLDIFAGLKLDLLYKDVTAPPRRQTVLEGEPTDANLVSVMSGLASPQGYPGFAWLCPVLPFRGEVAAWLAAAVEEEFGRAGVIPNLAMGARDTRTLRAYIALAWDRTVPETEARALAAHDRLLARCGRAGLPLFRLGPLCQGWQPAARGDTASVLTDLLNVLRGPV